MSKREVVVLAVVLATGLFFSVEFPTLGFLIAAGATIAYAVALRQEPTEGHRRSLLGLALSILLLMETIGVVVVTSS